MALTLTSNAFANEERIPEKFTCDSDNISPELSIAGVPEGTAALALIMDDPDIPQFAKEKFGIEVFDHWTVFNISPETTSIAEGGIVGTQGVTTRGEPGYTGPCPPPDHEPTEHRYFFRLYALDTELSLQEGATKADVLTAMEGHIIETAELMGRYSRA